MSPTSLRFLGLLTLFVVPALPGASQETQPATAGTAVIFTLQDFSGTLSTSDYQQTITDAVSSAVRSSGAFQVVAPADWRAEAAARSLTARDLLNGTTAIDVARDVGADIAFSGTFSIIDLDGTDQIMLSLQCWDTRTTSIVAGLEKATRFDLGFFVSLRDWIQGLIPALVLPPSAPRSAMLSSGKRASIVPEMTFLSPDEGMEVIVGDDRVVGTIADGKLTFSHAGIRAGTELQVTKRKSGYHESVQKVKAGPRIILTPLARTTSAAGELSWTYGQMLGGGGALRGYGTPDMVFSSLGMYAYVQPAAGAVTRAVIHTDLSFGFGSYLFFAADSPFRLSLGAGAGVVLSTFTQHGLPTASDFYFNVASLVLETRILGPSLFLRLDTRYFLGIGTNLLGRGWAAEGVPLATVGVLFK